MPKEVRILDVEGMSCSHCESSVKNAVGALAGVDRVVVDLDGGKVTVEYDAGQVALPQIKETIEEQGFDVK